MTPLLASRSRVDRAFERMYHRHVADVYRYSLAVLRNVADAEDVTQTTFMNAYRAFQRGEVPHKPQNWLITIAHNVCRQRFRQAARRPNEVGFDEDVAEALTVEHEGPTAEDLSRALGHLAFNQRSALVMRELEGRSYTEIADALGLSVKAVETLLFRARRALREQLEDGLTCHEAELAISRQLDGRLPRGERGPLRAHLRECAECATFARSQRAQRAAWRALGVAPLPASLSSFVGTGGVAVGTGTGLGIAAKAAYVFATAVVAGGLGYESIEYARAKGTASAEPARGVVVDVNAPASVARGTPLVSTSPSPRAIRTGAGVVLAAHTGYASAARPAAADAQARYEALGNAGPAQARRSENGTLSSGQVPKLGVLPPLAVTAAAAPPSASPAEKTTRTEQKPAGEHESAAVGLGGSELATRDKAKPKHEPVGLVESEQGAKQKAKGKAKEKESTKEERAAAAPPTESSKRGESRAEEPSESSDAPTKTEEQPAAEPTAEEKEKEKKKDSDPVTETTATTTTPATTTTTAEEPPPPPEKQKKDK